MGKQKAARDKVHSEVREKVKKAYPPEFKKQLGEKDNKAAKAKAMKMKNKKKYDAAYKKGMEKQELRGKKKSAFKVKNPRQEKIAAVNADKRRLEGKLEEEEEELKDMKAKP